MRPPQAWVWLSARIHVVTPHTYTTTTANQRETAAMPARYTGRPGEQESATSRWPARGPRQALPRQYNACISPRASPAYPPHRPTMLISTRPMLARRPSANAPPPSLRPTAAPPACVSLLHILLLVATATSLSSDRLPLVASRAAATEGRGGREVDVLLRLGPDDE